LEEIGQGTPALEEYEHKHEHEHEQDIEDGEGPGGIQEQELDNGLEAWCASQPPWDRWLFLRAFFFFLFVSSSVASLSRARTFPFPPPGIGGITKVSGRVLGPWMKTSTRSDGCYKGFGWTESEDERGRRASKGYRSTLGQGHFRIRGGAWLEACPRRAGQTCNN